MHHKPTEKTCSLENLENHGRGLRGGDVKDGGGVQGLQTDTVELVLAGNMGRAMAKE